VELALARLVVGTREQPLPEHLELDDAERSFDAEHQLVVERREVVELVPVADQGVEDLAGLAQAAPVFVGARQPRRLAADDDSDLAQRGGGEHPLESLSRGGREACARSEVVVDDVDAFPSEHARAFDQRVLQLTTLAVVLDLLLRRVPHVDDRAARESARGEPRIIPARRHRGPPLSRPRGWRDERR